MRALFRLPHGHEQYNIYLGVVKSLRAVAEFWSHIFWPASLTARNGLPTANVLISILFVILGSLTSSLAQDKSISSKALSQIGDLLKEKRSWTPAQNKLDSQLIFAAKRGRGLFFAPDAPHIRLDVDFEKDGRIRVEIDGIITPELLTQIESGGGKVFGPHIRRSKIRALLKPSQLEELAALPEISRIRRPIKAATSTGAIDSQGDVTHNAIQARNHFGVSGAGVKIGVLSDSIDHLSESQASGEIGPVTVLPGQSGTGLGGVGEGTAMLEILHDLAPDAELYFATGFADDTSFYTNILNLRSNGCDIIVDDVNYYNESPFQDGLVAQAVNTVTADGALFFSAAQNSGNYNSGTSGTWEGDFLDGGAVTLPQEDARIHNFGSVLYNTVAPGGGSRHLDLFWTDPLGASTNDYDVFVLDSSGSSVVSFGMDRQDGTEDPYEFVPSINIGGRIVIVKYSGESRFLHLDVFRGRLSIGTQGAVIGHAGSDKAFAIAAVNANTAFPNSFTGGVANPVESFSSDGPRRVFFYPDGSPITPGDYSSTGGAVRQKPDFAAADSVSTSVPGFTSFAGTSASAPHAAAIAALLLSYDRSLTSAQIRTIFETTALDVAAPGPDRDSGYGVLMASDALQYVADNLHISPRVGCRVHGPVGGPFVSDFTTFTLTNTGSSALTWSLISTSTWLSASISGGTLDSAGPAALLTLTVNSSANALPFGHHFSTMIISNVTTGQFQTRQIELQVGQVDYFTETFNGTNSTNDLAFRSFTFRPDGSPHFYSMCREKAVDFSTDPADGVPVITGNDGYVEITLADTNTVALYGLRTNVFFIGANGYITLQSGDSSSDGRLETHFILPRIAPLFTDLNPDLGGSVSWKQLTDRVAVTYSNVPTANPTALTNSFQIEMFMDGRIRITYLKVDATSGLAGLSAGGGLPSDFVASDWTAHSPCAGAAPGFVTEPANQSSPPGGLAVFHTTVSGSLPLFYQWLHNGVNLVDGPRVSGAKSQTLVLSNLEENDSGAYLVRVFNANGSIESSNAFLLVSPIDHFVWAHIPLPQADNVPFLISLEAQDAANMTVSNYNSAVTLMPIGGGASIVPVVLTNFVDGMWIGTARVTQAVTNVTIKAMDAFGHAGLSEPITILPQPILNLDSSGGMMNLSWTAGAPSLVLEKTPTLSPAQWAPFGTPVSVGDTWFIQVDTTDSQGFFRLHSSSP